MKGLSTRTTPLGWTVYRVHYSADPDKDPARRGKEWYAHGRKGMKDARAAAKIQRLLGNRSKEKFSFIL